MDKLTDSQKTTIIKEAPYNPKRDKNKSINSNKSCLWDKSNSSKRKIEKTIDLHLSDF